MDLSKELKKIQEEVQKKIKIQEETKKKKIKPKKKKKKQIELTDEQIASTEDEVKSNIEKLGNPEFVSELKASKSKTKKFLQNIYENLKLYLASTNKKVVIKVNNSYITLSRASLKRLFKKLSSTKETTELVYDSWKWVEVIVSKNEDVDIEFMVLDRETGPENDGGFFNKINISPFDLSQLGIVSKYYQTENNKFIDVESQLSSKIEEINSDHCIVSTLKYYKISENKLDLLRSRINCNLKKNKLKDIADLLKIQLILYHYKKDDNVACYKYGNNKLPKYKIALYNYHYFPYINIPISSFMAKNWKRYYKVEESSDYLTAYNSIKYNTKIIKKRSDNNEWASNNKAEINSLLLVKKLDESGSFITHRSFDDVLNCDNNRELNLDTIEDEYKKLDNTDKKYEEHATHIFYADFETITIDTKIKPFMIGLSSELDEFYIFESLTFDSEYLMNSIMDAIEDDLLVEPEDNIIVYFHNLKFDKTFFEKLHIISKCKKDGQYYTIKVLYNGRIFEFRDSYKLIPSPLKKFGGMFNIECAKQEIPYKIYTNSSIKLINIPFSLAIEELNKQCSNNSKIISEFIKSTKDFVTEDKFNHMEYMRFYLKMDCITLGQGLRIFDNKIKEITSLSTKDFLTISSLMYGYCKNNDVFQDQYTLTGNIRDYISKAIYGGRVCTRFNKKHHIKSDEVGSLISDLDGTSLYPSSIHRLCNEIGIPCGIPIKMTIDDFNQIRAKDFSNLKYFIVDIKIKNVYKKQQIPFIAYKNKEGSCIYTNSPPSDHIFTIDSITLQDWINFQKIEYEVLETGIKYTSFNKNFGKVISKLFKERTECKNKMKKKDLYSKEEIAGFNALQEIYKLMLNSSYGKTIIKPSVSKNVFITKYYDEDDSDFEKRFEKYLIKNYNRVEKALKYDKYYEITEIESYKANYNLCHIGVSILSMSKRIMNEVMDVIQDLNKPCYYQDTDSMHVLKNDIPYIATEYKKRYGKELIGNNLCQFHGDFQLPGCKEEVLSKELIILGKKCYMDVLCGVDEKGNQITGEHCRMKGINEAGLAYQRNKMKIKNNKKIYEELFAGKKLKFDLLYNGAFSIKYNNDHESVERTEFIRELQF